LSNLVAAVEELEQRSVAGGARRLRGGKLQRWLRSGEWQELANGDPECGESI
jgi:hypothetical protein